MRRYAIRSCRVDQPQSATLKTSTGCPEADEPARAGGLARIVLAVPALEEAAHALGAAQEHDDGGRGEPQVLEEFLASRRAL